jgi:hypothetical protein
MKVRTMRLFKLFTRPTHGEMIARELDVARCVLLRWQANAEAANYSVMMLQERIQRLEQMQRDEVN